MNPAEEAFICGTCGESHDGLPTDWGFRKPDEIYALSYLEEYERTRLNADLACLDGKRYFLRGVLPLPFTYREGDFCWGAWVEVSRKDHHFYVRNFGSEGSAFPRFQGRMANHLMGYRGTMDLIVEVQLGAPNKRPALWLPSASRHRLATDQRKGVDAKRHHELLKACGHFKKK